MRGLVTALLMVTWRRGFQIVTRNRTKEEGDIGQFLDEVRSSSDMCHRARGVAIYMSPSKSTTPLALKADLDRHGIFHERVLIVTVAQMSVPHVDPAEQFLVEVLGSGTFKVRRVTIRAGYHDVTDVPAALALARKRGMLERNLDLEHASYFLSQIRVTMTNDARYEPHAEARLHRHGPQRREPDRHLQAAGRPHLDGRRDDRRLSARRSVLN